jgi:pimeloyl-ACP methyl ester carboxylesterase
MIALYIFCGLILLIAVAAAYHSVNLKIESKKLVPIGTLVEMNGKRMHVYAEESSTPDKPALVFMAGSAMPSPVYNYRYLYHKLSEDFRIVIAERFGYGYSDISDSPRDIKTVLEETRMAIRYAGVLPPYILVPHSMSGIEALFWAQTYPKEISAIVGLDMALPIHYENMNVEFRKKLCKLLIFLTKRLGVQRLPFLMSSLGADNKKQLKKPEAMQQRYLNNKMCINKDVYNEMTCATENAKLINDAGDFHIPMLFFLSDGKMLKDWIKSSQTFIRKLNSASAIELGCSHNMQNDCPDLIAEYTKEFLNAKVSMP